MQETLVLFELGGLECLEVQEITPVLGGARTVQPVGGLPGSRQLQEHQIGGI